MKYLDFIQSKRHTGSDHGFEAIWFPDSMMDFQKSMTQWAVRKGRAALFEDCGLGKTIQELAWAQNVVMHTNKPVLGLAPLAVSMQMEQEAEKFGIEVKRDKTGVVASKITLTNYENLHKFSPSDFAGVFCDESSILKNYDGALRNLINDFLRKMPYRLLATATAAPNDFIELGTSSEALGYLGHVDMLGRFFKNDLGNIAQRRMYGEAPEWVFKGHAEEPFWRWVCSWARALRKPSDLGFDDGPFVLPPLIETQHLIEARTNAPGMLFALPASSLPEQREEKKRTIKERCEKVAEILSHGRTAVAWCHMNEEAAELMRLLPGAVEVSGKDHDDAKEEKFLDFIRGKIARLVTKPKIGALGLNFQHCHDATCFPSHSYEQYYQLARRFWRFGQKNQVNLDIVLTEGERKIMDNMDRKKAQAYQMFDRLVAEMNNSMGIQKKSFTKIKKEIPAWL